MTLWPVMGPIDFFRGFFRSRPATEPTPPEALALTKKYIDEGKLPMPSLKELGISGTANWAGSPMVEENTRLQRESGYGQPGTEAWGEWERMIHTNPFVAMALEFVTAQLRDAKVEVQPVSEELMPDRAAAEAQAKFCREQLFERSQPGWPALMEQFVRGSVGYGFSLHEKCFERIDHPLLPGGSGYGLAKLAERLPSSVHPQGWREKDGTLIEVRQWGQTSSGTWANDAIVTPVSKVLLFTRNRAGNNYLGFSQFRPVYFIVRAMAEIVKTIAISVIREGAGIPIAYSDGDSSEDLSKSQQKKLRKLLSNTVVHEYASLVMPKGWKAEWLYSPGANKGHVVEVYNALGLLILMQVFGQQLALGSGNTGSRSVGEVHDLRADSFVTGVKAGVEGIVNGDGRAPGTGLLCDLVRFNFPPPAGRKEHVAFPKLVITLKKARVEPAAKANATKTAIDAGVMTPTLDVENALREDLGYDPISEEDRDAHLEEKKAAAAEMAKSMAGAEPDDDEKGKPKGRPGFPPKKFAANTPWAPRRELREREKHVEFSAIDAWTKNAREAFEHKVRPIVGEMLLTALPDVRAAMGDTTDGKVDHEAIAALPLDTARLKAAVGDFIKQARAEGYRNIAGERKRGSRTRGQLTPVQLAADDRDPPTSDEADEREARNDSLLEAKRDALVRSMQSRLRRRLEEAAINVERTAGEPDDVVRDVFDEQLDTGAFRSDAGGVLMTSFNLGRDDFMARYGDDVEGVELSAVLDSNTCEACEKLDGQEFDFGSAGYEENCPPVRDCDGRDACRCLYVVQWK